MSEYTHQNNSEDEEDEEDEKVADINDYYDVCPVCGGTGIDLKLYQTSAAPGPCTVCR